MEHRVPMVASRLAVAALVACATTWAAAQTAPSPSASSSSQASASPSQPQDSPPSTQTQPDSSSSKVHRGTIHHTRVLEENSASPDLTHAEEFIQKQNYTAAEPLLRKVVDADSTSYVAWFDLGF